MIRDPSDGTVKETSWPQKSQSPNPIAAPSVGKDHAATFTTLGMLKLSEPRSAEDLQGKISRTLCAAGLGHRERASVYRSLAEAGLTITENQER